MNRSDDKNLLVITSYPPKSQIHGKGVVGIASYAKNTLKSLEKGRKDVLVSVLAEEINTQSETEYKDGAISVSRIWKRKSLLTFPRLIKEIIQKHKNTKSILIEFELSMFGGILHLFPFPVFLFVLKLLGKKTHLVLHQVIMDMEEIGPHLNISRTSLKAKIYSVFMRLFYSCILLLSDEVIVFEEILKEELRSSGNNSKVSVIPHGVESPSTKISKKDARHKLRIPESSFVILVFGFLAWYKGSDFIVEAISELKEKDQDFKNVHLIMAGGPNPNHLSKHFYTKYISAIERQAKTQGITVTGFVQEDKIPTYFQASDVVALPYRTFMSSSGPLSLAFTYERPFLLSRPLQKYFLSKDFQSALKTSGLTEKDITFELNTEDLSNAIKSIINNSSKTEKLTEFSSYIKGVRSWDMIGKMYYEKLFN